MALLCHSPSFTETLRLELYSQVRVKPPYPIQLKQRHRAISGEKGDFRWFDNASVLYLFRDDPPEHELETGK